MQRATRSRRSRTARRMSLPRLLGKALRACELVSRKPSLMKVGCGEKHRALVPSCVDY